MVNLYRAHGVSKGAWWYATYPPDEGFGGRFDLPKGGGYGTCYVANNELTALRERHGPRLMKAQFLPREIFSDCLVTPVPPNQKFRTASLVSGGEAVFSVKATEMSSSAKYEVTRTWALAWHGHGRQGVWYRPGWDSREAAMSLAIFGMTGKSTGPITPPGSQRGEKHIQGYSSAFGVAVLEPLGKGQARIEDLE
ncbi:RES family NAD+ phosphorylase [Streptomyces longwoodensis]|uniref:RES family NAD+ phosphorylase n=1 Tax=Streptomyces longwoodensis TaxID=68231 RepID=UPI00352E7D3F